MPWWWCELGSYSLSFLGPPDNLQHKHREYWQCFLPLLLEVILTFYFIYLLVYVSLWRGQEHIANVYQLFLYMITFVLLHCFYACEWIICACHQLLLEGQIKYFDLIWREAVTCLLTSAMASCSTISMLSAPWTVVLSECRTLWHSLLNTLTTTFRRSPKASMST